MDLQTAQTLKANDLVADSDGKQYIFIKLDEENDLVVICRQLWVDAFTCIGKCVPR